MVSAGIAPASSWKEYIPRSLADSGHMRTWLATTAFIILTTIAYVFLTRRGAPESGGGGNQAHRSPIERDTRRGSRIGTLQLAEVDADRTTDASADPHNADPGLLKKHSIFRTYTTTQATYNSIRTFYRRHLQEDKLPQQNSPLPLLVFVHGLGGSLAQFKAVLTSVVDVAPCLGIDFPGCGRSGFSPKAWSAYTPDALAELLSLAIEEHLAPNQGFVLVAHSLGCSISALLASSVLAGRLLGSSEILGLIGICPPPPVDVLKGRKINILKALLCIPTPIFDLWRAWNRRGGPYSASVARFVGVEAEVEVKRLQERFNAQSKTPVYRRMAWGLLPHGKGSTGMASFDTWAKLKIPILLIGGEGDAVTDVRIIDMIAQALGKKSAKPSSNGSAVGKTGNRIDTQRESTAPDSDSLAEFSTHTTTSHNTVGRPILKTSILPAPASHALLYDPSTSRTLCGLIHAFLSTHISPRLSLGWQLQQLSIDGKWDVKNLVKWQSVIPISEPIGHARKAETAQGIFRAMKTLREVDEAHCPQKFATQYGNCEAAVGVVVDISHDSPVYDPRGLEEKGIEYVKFPTVSKMPPTRDEVREFIALVDRLRKQPNPAGRSQSKSTTRESSSDAKEGKANKQQSDAVARNRTIAVHCHYGFNRTGFFICAYLIERLGYTVQEAVEEFALKRPPGIRHEHFLDELWVRYCIGLKRSGTL